MGGRIWLGGETADAYYICFVRKSREKTLELEVLGPSATSDGGLMPLAEELFNAQDEWLRLRQQREATTML